MKKLFAFIFAIIFLLALTRISFATGFTVSNITFDNTTKSYSFDYSGISYTPGYVEIKNDNAGSLWDWAEDTASCTSSHCSGTVSRNSTDGTEPSCGSLVIGVSASNFTLNANSQSMTNPDPSCSSAT